MGFAFASVGFHKVSLLTFEGSHKKFKKKKLHLQDCSQWHWHLAKQGEVYSWTLAPSDTSLIGRRLQFHLLQVYKDLFSSVGPDLLRPVVISSSNTILELKLPGGMTFCPLRAHFLDRTNAWRKGKISY